MSDLAASRVAIIDYGMGNLFSVKQACEHVGFDAFITHESKKILGADGAILPGVGAFGDAMEHLEKLGLVGAIQNFIRSGKPFMGICLGMQLLMSRSEEFGVHEGLGIIEGAVVRFSGGNKDSRKIKVPQVGWNHIFMPEGRSKDFWIDSPLNGLESGECMYFVHSYYAIPVDGDVILSVTRYGDVEYCSSIRWKNVFATQFHPERSASAGIQVYKNWASMISEVCKR